MHLLEGMDVTETKFIKKSAMCPRRLTCYLPSVLGQVFSWCFILTS